MLHKRRKDVLYINFDYLESTTGFRSINTCTDILSTVAILLNLMTLFFKLEE